VSAQAVGRTLVQIELVSCCLTGRGKDSLEPLELAGKDGNAPDDAVLSLGYIIDAT
jgi:hypothetical protein